MNARSAALALGLVFAAALPFACKGGDGGDVPAIDGGPEVADAFDAKADGETIASELQAFPHCATATSSPAPTVPHVPWSIDGRPLVALDGTTLTQLHPRRGLLAFDAKDVDHPTLRARVPSPGLPVLLQVSGGIALTVLTDVYDQDAGKPFYGSLLRLVDLRDLAAPKILAESRLPRWVRKAMVVDDRLYLATRGPVFRYGDLGKLTGEPVYALESFKIGASSFTAVGTVTYAGRSVATVMTRDAIVVASAVPKDVAAPYGELLPATDVQLVDLTNASGSLVVHGTIRTTARIADDGFADPRGGLFFDGRYAQVIGCTDALCGGGARWQLSTVDFGLIDTPDVTSERPIPLTGEGPIARLEGGRLWLTPPTATSITFFDLKDPAHPALGPTIDDVGPVLDLRATASRLYVLERTLDAGTEGRRVTMLDVADATKPAVLDSTTFDAPATAPDGGIDRLSLSGGVLALPTASVGKAGVRLFPATTSALGLGTTVDTAHGVADVVPLGERFLATSLASLAVLDARSTPKLSSETLLARDVVAVTLSGTRLLELSRRLAPESGAVLRLLDASDGEERAAISAAPELALDGEPYALFSSDTQAIVVGSVRVDAPCATGTCRTWTDRVQVFDVVGKTPKLVGQVALPTSEAWNRSGDAPTRPTASDATSWCQGAPAVLVAPDLLAIRRFPRSHEPYDSTTHDVWIVDLKDPTSPRAASTAVTKDPNGWWGNLTISDGSLLATHVEPVDPAAPTGLVRFFVDRVDVSDRASPKVVARPSSGIAIGTAPGDVSILYAIRSASSGATVVAEKGVAAGVGELSRATLGGAVGLPLVRGGTLYLSVAGLAATSRLHAIDLGTPTSLADRLLTPEDLVAGLAVGAIGERLVFPSGYGAIGFDVFRLDAGKLVYEGTGRATRKDLAFVAHDTKGIWFGGGEWGISAFP